MISDHLFFILIDCWWLIVFLSSLLFHLLVSDLPSLTVQQQYRLPISVLSILNIIYPSNKNKLINPQAEFILKFSFLSIF